MFVAGVVVHVMLVDVVARRLHMNDFGKFYYAARLFLDGRNMYEPSPATFIPVGPKAVHVFLNLNPPHFPLLVLPLSVLPVETAGVIWLGVPAPSHPPPILCPSFSPLDSFWP
jgi:hypothetical protein